MTPITTLAGASAVQVAIYSTSHVFTPLLAAGDTTTTILNSGTLIPLGGFALVAGGLFYAGTQFQAMRDALAALREDNDRHEERLTDIEKNGCGLKWKHDAK